MKDAPCWLVRLRPRMHTIRKAVLCFTIPLTILGVVLSTMHQSSLGALFLIAPSKMHPLWYSPFMPVFFFLDGGRSFDGHLRRHAVPQGTAQQDG